ncbi:MAG TPA: mannosyltransferase family protein [Ktedonobacterales bacterium]
MRTATRTSTSRPTSQRRSVRDALVTRLPAPLRLEDARRPLPWRSLLLSAGGLWLATRVAFVVLTLVFPMVSEGLGTTNGRYSATISLSDLIRRWTIWDAAWYIRIAKEGYWAARPTAFFPLYPALIRFVSVIIGPHWNLAALLASNLGALLAFCGVGALAAQVAPRGEELARSRLALTIFAAYPMAFFLVAAYTDGLFAGLAAYTLLFALRRRWGWAAAFAFLAALCRPTAPALILPLAWEAFQRYRERRQETSATQALRELAPALGACAAPIAAIAAYSAWLWLRFGDPLIFITAEKSWGRMQLPPIVSIPLAIFAFLHIAFGSTFQLRVALDLAPVLGGIALTLIAARRAPIAFTLYMLGLMYLITSSPINSVDVFVSGSRYMLAAVPLFIIVASWLRRSEWALLTYCWTCALLQAALTLFFLAHGSIL